MQWSRRCVTYTLCRIRNTNTMIYWLYTDTPSQWILFVVQNWKGQDTFNWDLIGHIFCNCLMFGTAWPASSTAKWWENGRSVQRSMRRSWMGFSRDPSYWNQLNALVCYLVDLWLSSWCKTQIFSTLGVGVQLWESILCLTLIKYHSWNSANMTVTAGSRTIRKPNWNGSVSTAFGVEALEVSREELVELAGLAMICGIPTSPQWKPQRWLGWV